MRAKQSVNLSYHGISFRSEISAAVIVSFDPSM